MHVIRNGRILKYIASNKIKCNIGSFYNKVDKLSFMKGVVISRMLRLQSLNFYPLFNKIRTGDFSTNGFVCLLQISFVYVDFSKILVTMQ